MRTMGQDFSFYVQPRIAKTVTSTGGHPAAALDAFATWHDAILFFH